MGIMTTKQYKRLQEAKAAGDKDLVKQILNEKYGEDSTIMDVEIIEELDYDTVESDKSAGLSNSEIAKKHGVTVQKINAIIKKGA